MQVEIKPVKVTYQITLDRSDYRKPRYVAKLGKRVVSDGRTLNEVRDQITHDSSPFVEPYFIVMAE